MTDKQPTDKQMKSLPLWAVSHIGRLLREREEAVKSLHEFRDSQESSPVSYEELLSTGEQAGPTNYRRFIHSESIDFVVGEDRISVQLCNESVRVSSATGALVVRPQVTNSVLISVENLISAARKAR